ncbi:MAG TPA: hypothetical protein VF646_03690 [Cytophagales bacterium]
MTAFVFLWGLVNYNSFQAQQARIGELRAAAAELQERFATIVERLRNHFGTAGTAAPGHSPMPGPEPADSTPPDSANRLAAAWQRFAESHPSSRDEEEVAALLNELQATAEAQHRTRLRLSSAIAGYNGHRQRMPYRLVAQLFHFRPIPPVA